MLSSRHVGDGWCMLHSKKIIQFQYATVKYNDVRIHGMEIKKTDNFFTKPFSSKFINIFTSDGNQLETNSYSIADVMCKMVSLSLEKKFVFIPLLHTLN